MDEAVEITLTDTEEARRLRAILVGFRQCAFDEGPFEHVHLVVKAVLCCAVGGSSFCNRFRQILGKNEFRVSDHDGSFDGISQFADISRPVIEKHEPVGFRSESQHRPAAGKSLQEV